MRARLQWHGCGCHKSHVLCIALVCGMAMAVAVGSSDGGWFKCPCEGVLAGRYERLWVKSIRQFWLFEYISNIVRLVKSKK